jgi:NAD(P)-dependent dehydrogenase (short-subunit alcohol dehydrogenase family)
MNDRIVTVFGGTGFLGRRVVRHLRKRGFAVRIASKHPDRCHPLFGHDDPQLRPVQADVRDERSVANALAGAYAVVNAVSLYVEHGHETFHSMHVESAERLAVLAFRAGVKRFAHTPALGKALLLWWDERTQRSLPSQHIALTVSTMIALTALIAIYGVVWKANPRLIAWYAWISPEIPIEGSVDIQEPLKVEIAH